MGGCKQNLTKIATGLGLGGLYLFALGAWMSTSLASIGLGLMFIAFILHSVVFPSIWRDDLLVVSLAFGVYLVPRTILAIWELPDLRAARKSIRPPDYSNWVFLPSSWSHFGSPAIHGGCLTF